MKSDGIFVFVYGTLLQGEANHRRLKDARRAADRAVARGALYDTRRGYPALLAHAECVGTVLGEIYEIDESTLRSLDELEDFYGPGDPRNEYERIRIDAQSEAGGAWTEVWTYVYKKAPANGDAIPSGDWRTYRRQREGPPRDRWSSPSTDLFN